MVERLHLLEQRLAQWLNEMSMASDFRLTPASADASFRRYFRVSVNDSSFIVMDAPPAHEDCRPFVAISRAMIEAGLHVPEVLKADLEQGFLLLTDLGQQQYLQVLDVQSVTSLYADAMQALLVLQKAPPPRLPSYSHELLRTEMDLFRDWFVQAYLGQTPSAAEQSLLAEGCELLAQQALAQPQVWVHRDYHSRNLMWLEQSGDTVLGRASRLNPGILDFQDAVVGPICYDLVSLLRDCYISWPRQQVKAWVDQYHRDLVDAGLVLKTVSDEEFQRWFDWIGVQRHLKAIGIFARLNIRDDKPGYLADIPRTLRYVLQVCHDYQELRPLHDWLQKTIVPLVITSLSVDGDFFRAEV